MTSTPFSITTLADGTHMILAPRHETEAVTLLVLFGVGSRYEQKQVNGISHFLEHLMFKGTKRRPNTLDIARELDGVGAEYNAFTAKDHTGYYIKVDARHLDMAIDIMSDILNNSIFDPVEIERERHVIVEEINMYEDNPIMYMDDLFELTLFGTHPLGRLISGPRETVLKIKRPHIVNYRKTYYKPANTAIVLSGRFPEKNMVKKISRAFIKNKARGTGPKYPAFKKYYGTPRVSFLKRKTEQVQLALGFPGPAIDDKAIYPIMLLTTILGGNMSSRLFIKIRERLGLCYFIKADQGPYQDAGSISIRAGLARTKIDQAISHIWEELEKIITKPVTASELYRAKEFLSGKLMLSLEDSEAVANWLGKQYLLAGKLESAEQKLKKLKAVSREDILTYARRYIKKKNMALAIIGPDGSKKHYQNLIDRL
ncbi:M16 family metallopeptidase [Patescibacteria group bacterium]